MHQEAFAGFQAPAFEHVGPHGEEGFRHAGGLGHAQACRHRQGVGLVHHAVLGIAAAGHQRADLVADVPLAGTFAKGCDFASDFQPRRGRCAGWGRITALALKHVRPVDAGCGHLDQYLALAGLRCVDGAGHQRFGAAWLGDGDGGHGSGNGCHVRSLPDGGCQECASRRMMDGTIYYRPGR
jgi:hypothetical protein